MFLSGKENGLAKQPENYRAVKFWFDLEAKSRLFSPISSKNLSGEALSERAFASLFPLLLLSHMGSPAKTVPEGSIFSFLKQT